MVAGASSGGSQAPAPAGRERSRLAPSLLLSAGVHLALAAALMVVPGAPPSREQRVRIELAPEAPPPPPPPSPEPPPPAPPRDEPRPEAGPAPSHRRAAASRPHAAASAPAETASAAPLSGLASEGPGLAFDMPSTPGPKGMAFPAPGQEPGTATVGPAAKPPPIRLDDGTRSEEEVRRVVRELKAGFEAQPHSFSVQKYGGPVARQATYFPGFGDVPADKVCRTRDGTRFRTTVPAFDLTVCDRFEIDRSRIDDHTEAPPVICVASHVQHVEERTLEAPRSYLSHECMQRDPDHWDIDWEKRTVQYRCIRWIDVQRENPLVYRAKRFTDSFEEDRGISMKIAVPVCDDEPEEQAAQGQGEEERAAPPKQPQAARVQDPGPARPEDRAKDPDDPVPGAAEDAPAPSGG